MKKYTVITGASRGLGKALALECAKRGFNLILISLPNENLKEIAYSLKQKFRIETEIIEADLTQSSELESAASWINKRFRVKILINNAGIGGSQTFQNTDPNYLNNILMLNIRALVMLTHSLLPNIRENEKAYILNIASMASFGPMPYKTVYPASKAFVYSFSRGLQSELTGTGVTVSVAHPGGMATNPEIAQRISKHSRLVRTTILSPQKTANICIRQLLRKDTLIIPGLMNKFSYAFFKTCPVWLQLTIFRFAVKKELKSEKLQYA